MSIRGNASANPALQLHDTRAAFDSVAADYDGPRGNNSLIQQMRSDIWECFGTHFAAGSELLELGCGTGLDAIHLAQAGHRVLATDWSPLMIERTEQRAREAQVAVRVRSLVLGAQELERLPGAECFDGAYSSFGALNCVPDLAGVARECHRLLRADAPLVLSVIGRVCPWEIAHYLRLRRWGRVRVRFARDVVPVGLNTRTVWTRYYTPRELYRRFARHFRLVDYRALALFVPPPYLEGVCSAHPRWHATLRALDRRCASWPLLRSVGDHFLIVMRRR